MTISRALPPPGEDGAPDSVVRQLQRGKEATES